MRRIATYVLLRDGEVAAFYSLGMSKVLLRSQHRKQLAATHPRQGAVLILWLARASDASVDAETILRHAVGMGQIGARRVGAAVIALDPDDEETERFWRERFGFRGSLTRRPDADGIERPRLWLPLFPERLSGLLHPRLRAGGIRYVLLGVEAELTPALVEPSLLKLVLLDRSRRFDGFVNVRRRS